MGFPRSPEFPTFSHARNGRNPGARTWPRFGGTLLEFAALEAAPTQNRGHERSHEPSGADGPSRNTFNLSNWRVPGKAFSPRGTKLDSSGPFACSSYIFLGKMLVLDGHLLFQAIRELTIARRFQAAKASRTCHRLGMPRPPLRAGSATALRTETARLAHCTSMKQLCFLFCFFPPQPIHNRARWRNTKAVFRSMRQMGHRPRKPGKKRRKTTRTRWNPLPVGENRRFEFLVTFTELVHVAQPIGLQRFIFWLMIGNLHLARLPLMWVNGKKR